MQTNRFQTQYTHTSGSTVILGKTDFGEKNALLKNSNVWECYTIYVYMMKVPRFCCGVKPLKLEWVHAATTKELQERKHFIHSIETARAHILEFDSPGWHSLQHTPFSFFSQLLQPTWMSPRLHWLPWMSKARAISRRRSAAILMSVWKINFFFFTPVFCSFLFPVTSVFRHSIHFTLVWVMPI